MLGLGWTEMLVIGIAALIFVGPKDLPVVMNRIGKIAGQIRRMGAEFQREINKTTGLDEVRNLRNSITAPLKKTTDEIRREFNAMTPTGVKPTGVIKPADPKVESVTEEIRAAAGMPPAVAKPVASAAVPAAETPVVAEPAKKAPVKAKAAPTRPVISIELQPLQETAPVVSEPVLPPAVIEPVAAKKPAARKPAVKTAQPSVVAARPVSKTVAVKAQAAVEPETAKPAPRKRAAKATTTSAGNE